VTPSFASLRLASSRGLQAGGRGFAAPLWLESFGMGVWSGGGGLGRRSYRVKVAQKTRAVSMACALAKRQIACHHEGMSNAATLGSPEDDDSPEVRALRKQIRNEPLTSEEQALLASVSRTIPAGAVLVPHDEVTRKLEERRRREG
jgi:hypothetical protein